MEEQNKEIIAQYMEHDAAVLQENGVHPKEVGQTGSIKSRYWKFMGGFFVVLVIGAIGTFLLGIYININTLAKERGELIQNIH